MGSFGALVEAYLRREAKGGKLANSHIGADFEVDQDVEIEVSDDGKGFADDRPDGRYGLTIMAERAERIRGRLKITPRHPSGTTVAVVLGSPAGRDRLRDSVSAPEGE